MKREELADLRARAQQKIEQQMVELAMLSPEDIAHLVQELRIHQIELEMQNEELRQAYHHLQEARDRYSELYDFAPVGYFVLDPAGLILEANLTGASQLGVPRSKLLRQRLTDYIHPDSQDRFYLHCRQVLTSGTSQVGEVELVRSDHSHFYARLESTPVEKRQDQAGRLRLAMIDITARRQAEAALRQAHAELEARVRARTGDLIVTNQQLRQQIEERQQAEAALLESQQRLQALLEDKEVLLRELHHRVKNNLQAVSSLLYLSTPYIQAEQARQIFRESQDRIQSIVLIHEQLNQAADLAQVNFAEYIYSLARRLIHSYGANPDLITLRVNVAEVSLDIERATALGMIIHELISNSLKYAFVAAPPYEIRVDLSTTPKWLTLQVGDNGAGLPDTVPFPTPQSLGLQLVSMLVERLSGTVELERHGGTTFKFTFPYG